VDLNDMLLFNEAISNLGIMELPIKGRKFTWSNMHKDPLLEKLDWFFTLHHGLFLTQPLFLTHL
jgi:hypothetical protein